MGIYGKVNSAGCSINEGIGHGIKFKYTEHVCAGSGGSSAGVGGIGVEIPKTPGSPGNDSYQCRLLADTVIFKEKLYPYNSPHHYAMGSGGSGFTSGTITSLSSAGGGLIKI